MQPKRFVYIVKSLEHATTFYVGVTSDPVARLAARNAGLTGLYPEAPPVEAPRRH